MIYLAFTLTIHVKTYILQRTILKTKSHNYFFTMRRLWLKSDQIAVIVITENQNYATGKTAQGDCQEAFFS